MRVSSWSAWLNVVHGPLFSDKELEIGQLHTRWQIILKTVLLKKHMSFTVTAYILRAQYELLTL